MMPIRVVCKKCSSAFRAPDIALGKQAACPKCSESITIAAQPSATAKPRAKDPPVGTTKREAAADAKRLTTERMLAAFQGPIEPVKTTRLYRVGILLSLATMLLLPLVYLGLIAGASYLVYYHGVNHTVIFAEARGRNAFYAFLLYLAPLVAGPIIILFMIKPLFARSANNQRTRSVLRENEPLLFAFVDKICETVNAPTPKRIDIDCQVNASASFRKGMLSMLGNDLVLTIGVPLVAGMSVRQLGGVLAHEFGHFTQGVGMRLTYLVRSISYWFVRVVYERDEWDEWLSRTAASIDLRIGWVLWLAILSVWTTRKILWVLLHLGMGVAGFTLRQMEFDADRYEARFAGSKTFATTARRLQQLNAGMQVSYGQLGSAHQEGRLADDLPSLMMINTSRLPKEVTQRIDESLEQGATGWFDTHPCDKDRIASAAAEQAGGVFTLDVPASQLFRDFPLQSKVTTLEFYRTAISPEINESALEPVSQLIATHDKEQAGDEKFSSYYQQTVRAYRRVPITSSFLNRPEDPQAVADRLKAARKRFVAGGEVAREHLKAYDESYNRLTEAFCFIAFHDAKMCIDKKSVENVFHTRAAAKAENDKVVAKLRAIEERLVTFDEAIAERIHTAMQLLQFGRIASRIENGVKQREHVDRLLSALVSVDGQMETLNQLVLLQIQINALLQQISGQPDESIIQSIDKLVGRAHPKMLQVREVLANTAYPFDHKQRGMTIGEFVLANPPLRNDLGAVVDALPEMTDRLIAIRRRTLGELADIAEQIESLLGMAPLEALPVSENSDAEHEGQPA